VQRLARRLGAAASQAIDATNEMAVRVMTRQISKALGGLDLLIFCADLGDNAAHSLALASRFAAREMAAGRAGSLAILAQLAECLFIEAVRRYVDSFPTPQPGWLAGFGDPVVGRALSLLHARTDHPWTVEELAGETGLSRSAFADRFARVMGEPPMRYLAKQRLRFAAQRLRTSHEPIARIAYDAGYESEAAFNRAFKRELGVPPAAWRARSADSPSRWMWWKSALSRGHS